MSVIQAESPRRGGREARRALRAAPLALNERPVWPGMTGGNFKPLTEADQQRIHQAALDVLEQVGFADAIPSGIEAMTRAGAKLESNGRLTFPRALVEDTIAMAARKFPLCGQDPKFDMEPWGKKVLIVEPAVAELLSDPCRLERMGRESRSWVVNQFDWSQLTRQAGNLFAAEQFGGQQINGGGGIVDERAFDSEIGAVQRLYGVQHTMECGAVRAVQTSDAVLPFFGKDHKLRHIGGCEDYTHAACQKDIERLRILIRVEFGKGRDVSDPLLPVLHEIRLSILARRV